MNYFASCLSAERYAIGRPHFHANTIRHIIDNLKIEVKLNNALDVACGTGLSTIALLPIADNVFGTDLSEEMLKLAVGKNQINYQVSTAEEQPFQDNIFNLITVSSGLHWFNIDKFLTEANRLLKRDSFLVVYENSFPGEMKDNAGFNPWNKETYLQQFPSPPRNKNYDWAPDNLKAKGFLLCTTENFKNLLSFNKSELIAYLTTQSNVIAAVEKGRFTYNEIENWLNEELSAFFDNDQSKQILYFNNWIKYLQKVA
jgi:ubiquinone/menaquinone biosynthesis C-methylase UbiE